MRKKLVNKVYIEKIRFVQDKVEEYVQQIFKVYGNELLLSLEDYNLLEDEKNCIESSTSTGFIIEEFLTSKLKIYTQNHLEDEIIVEKHNTSTINSSYDCYVKYKDILVMINLKIEKQNNNGVAAINILHNDYVLTNPEQEKVYLILKINYEFNKSKIDGQRKIFIKKVYSYYLEEIDFSKGYSQDNRNWSANYNHNSGRLLISKKADRLEEDSISYENTKNYLNMIFDGKLSKK